MLSLTIPIFGNLSHRDIYQLKKLSNGAVPANNSEIFVGMKTLQWLKNYISKIEVGDRGLARNTFISASVLRALEGCWTQLGSLSHAGSRQ
jgi:hypothetical protein